jgi:hypothetical protein
LPKRWRTTPGAGIDDDRWTTQPMTRAGGIAAVSEPSASVDARRVPCQRPGSPWKNHHGTPFIAESTAVCSPHSGVTAAAAPGSAVVFTARITRS